MYTIYKEINKKNISMTQKQIVIEKFTVCGKWTPRSEKWKFVWN